MARARKTQKAYWQYLKATNHPCVFCAEETIAKQKIGETEYFWLLTNLFPYETWDYHTIKDHIMAVPKRHMTSISQLNPAETKEYIELLCKYEASGYSVYSRTPSSKAKSIPHLHTHFIKLGDQKSNLVFYISKPYMLVHK
jgi:diadenosine tetraphosphate (Ap4A) HIT family hydrolase